MKKKNCVWLVCMLLCMSASVKGQKLIVENGVAITALPKGPYAKNKVPYQMSVGYNYMEKGWYFLSSNIGYLQKGGRIGIPVKNNMLDYYDDHDEFVRLHYITMNTVFNVYKMSHDGYKFFVGAGPRIDFRVRSYFSYYEQTKGTPYETLNPSELIKPVSVGLKLVAGMSKKLGGVDLGLNVAYLPTFNNPGKYETNYRDRTFTIGVTFGFSCLKGGRNRIYSVRHKE